MSIKTYIDSNSIKHYQGLSGLQVRTSADKKKRYFTAMEAAETLGISKQTLIRYEARGIFPKASRNQVNRWREYTELDIQNLQKIMGR